MRLLAAAWVCLVVGGGAKQPGTTTEQLAFATSDEVGFSRMPKPEPGDWLARFREPGQGFERYVRTQPVRAGKGDVLAFLPVGPFSKEERAILDLTVEFAGLWFGLPTKVLDPRPLPKTGWQRTHFGRKQYRTPYFLRNLLPDHMPPNAVCLFGVTMADLYPDDDWNYVFGQASLRGQVLQHPKWCSGNRATISGGREPNDEASAGLRGACPVSSLHVAA